MVWTSYPNFPKFVNGKFEFVKDAIKIFGTKITKLTDEGVLLIKGAVKGEKYPNYPLIYKRIVLDVAKIASNLKLSTTNYQNVYNFNLMKLVIKKQPITFV